MSHLRKTPSRSRPVISDRVIGRSNRMLVNRLTNDKSPLCQRAYLLSHFYHDRAILQKKRDQ